MALLRGGDHRSNGNAEFSALKTQTQVAHRFNVDRRTVQAARKVQEKGSAQLQKAVEDGKGKKSGRPESLPPA